MPSDTLAISLFDHARDTQPKGRRCTVNALLHAFTRFPVVNVSDKLDLPAWSPARFLPERTRNASSVVDLSCLVLDHDGGDPDAALAAWEGLTAVAHSTWSHTEEMARFRVVVPLARPVPVARWGVAWSWAVAKAPGADRACKDAARIYFRPAIRSQHTAHFFQVQRGALLDILALLPEDDPPTPRPVTLRPPLVVPARLRDHAIDVRLARDPASRERVAGQLGAAILGDGHTRRASGIHCPNCGRASVWFYISAERMRRASCNHRNSCGWVGRLDELLVARAA